MPRHILSLKRKFMKLLGTSYKIEKSNTHQVYRTKIMYLLPHKMSGKNLCANASPGCIGTCLNTSGRGRMNSVQEARLKKAQFFINNPSAFFQQLKKELTTFEKSCERNGFSPAVRLNGITDVPWEYYNAEDGFNIIDLFPNILFYDYTKSYARMTNFLSGEFPSNYHLTFSRSELNETESLDVLRRGGNVAVVFRDGLPSKWKRFTVFDGDKNDLRFLDPHGVCGLLAKGKAKHDKTGFVI